MCATYVHRCLQRLEGELHGSHEAVVTGSCELPDLGAGSELASLEGQQMLLPTEPAF